MTTTDLTRKRKFGEKKTKSVSSARLQLADVVGLSTNVLNLFNLPPDAIVTDAYVIVDDAAQGGVTVDFGFAGGTEFGSALAVSATGVKEKAESIATLTLNEATPNTLNAGTVTKALRLQTLTGKTVTAKFSAEPNETVDMTFVVEYIEYRLSNGDLTTVTAA